MSATAPRSIPEHHAPRWIRRFIAIEWAGTVLAILSLWLQHQLGVYHTCMWLWLPFAMVGLLAGVAAGLLSLTKLLFGPRRRLTFGWLTIIVLPGLLAVLLVGYMLYERGRRNVPNTHAHKVGKMASITLFELHARFLYPYRLETDRLVMYYDDRVTNPAADAAAMENHLAQLEKILGRQQHSPIHWVRGSALGQTFMSVHSIALGTDSSPPGSLDRHELAHAFLFQFSSPQGEPPMLLLEGWAMAVDGHPVPLADTALDARRRMGVWRNTSSALRSILAPDLYHVGISEAYDMGGAFVDFLLKKYGNQKLLTFYNAVHPENFESQSEQVFGCSWDALEQQFWSEMEKNAKSAKRLP